ncbi:OmpA family protein [Archangium lansingense]|uniref:OmpA family protein n=1 Tax=Archangium lansingense TaxID=2995310 RepID=A0ABT4ANH2_9BACT|nr:OmpA family protein [Archangium lansinium]MCY1082821.1 OmpA family protein [Archangium lansinium]
MNPSSTPSPRRTIRRGVTLTPLCTALALLVAMTSGCTRSDTSEESARPETAVSTQSLFTNGNFEEGTLNGWTVTTHLNPGITIPPTSTADLNFDPGGTNRTAAKEATGGPETQIPAGLTAADSLRWPKYGKWAAVVNELGNQKNVNRLVQSATLGTSDVDPADGKLHVRFALAPVLQNPNHEQHQQPYIYITLRNVTRNTVLWSTFNFANQPGVPWKTTSGNIQYTDWQAVDVAPGDAHLSVGDTVELEVIAAGCSPGAHWGHVYVDGFGSFLPGLSIAASAPKSSNTDSDLTYTYLVKNSGEGPVDNTTVTIVLPDQTSFVSIDTPPGVTCTHNSATRTVTCDLGTMNPTASTTFDVKVHIDPTATGQVAHGNYNVGGKGVSPLIGPLVQTALTTNVSYADLSASISDGVVAVGWDRPVSYTLDVSNHGPNAANGAAIDHDIPAALTGVSWTCVASGGATCPAASGTGNIHTTADLPVGGKLTYTVAGQVIPGSGSDSITNRASVSVPAGMQDPDDTNNTAVDVNGVGTLHTVTAQKDPTSTGSGTIVTSPAAINCGPSCDSASADFLEGSQVSLTATAQPGSTFAGWSGGCTGTTNPCTLTVSQATNVTALFTVNTYPITTSSNGPGGSVSCPSPIVHGQPVTCTVTVTPGYTFGSLTDNDSEVTSSVSGGTYVLTNVTQAHDLVASFTKRPGTDWGGECTTDSDCSTGFCTDGVCCDTSCDGQCEACNTTGSVGTCGAVTGAPRGDRPACGSDGSECGGVCDGTTRDTCSFPEASVQCGSASCSEGVAVTGGACNGAGACTLQTQSCGDYACGETACFDACTSDDQCAENSFCLNGTCKPEGDHSKWLVQGSGCSTTAGTASLWPLVLGSLSAFLRRRRKTGAVLAAAAAVSAPAAALAQEDLSRSFLVERFQPQPGRDDLLGVQSAHVPEHLTFSARLFADYAHHPLRLVSTDNPSFQRILVGGQTYLTLAGSVALFDRFELGAALPMMVYQTTSGAGMVDPNLQGALATTAFSDLRLNLKTALLRSENYGLALALPVTFPTAPKDSYLGGGSVTFNPTLVGEWRGPRGSAVMANAGIYFGRPQRFLNLHLGTSVTYGIGGKVDLVPRWKLALLSTLSGEVGLMSPSVPTSPLELLMALRWGFYKNLEMTVGAGPGLTNGFGTPRFRALAAISYAPSDSLRRPVQPAPPPPAPIVTAPPPPPPPPALVANDDAGRVLAGQSITLNILQNDEGQPGELLRVTEVGVTSSGGIVETTPEGALRYTAKQGFSGRDTFTYRVAGSPDRSAMANVVVMVEAPPPPPPPPAPSKVVVEKGKLRTLEKVFFATDKDNALAQSLPILDQVADVLETNPDIKKLRIEAHTDSAGKASYNKDLSQRRARWVREYLVQKGITPDRLTSEGFGMEKPIDTNATADGRANNRRVEFVVLE